MTANAGPLVILCDTREQRIPPFPDGVVLERATLAEGDYTSELLQGIAAIERKGLDDAAASLIGCERFDDEVRRLLPYRFKAVVVEGNLGQLYRARLVHPHAVLGKIASLFARWDLPVLFVENPAGCGRLIAGLLKRWQDRVAAENEAGSRGPSFTGAQ